MNSRRSFRKIRNLVLGVAAVVVFAGVASAQVCHGKFKLPVETRWGLATLPAGEYAFSLSQTSYPAIVTLRGNGTAAMVIAQTVNKPISDKSELVLIRSGNKGVIRTMTLADLGTFYYPPRKGEPELLAQSSEVTERVPIKLEGK